MKNLTLSKIARACGGTLYGGNGDLEVEGVVTDSRQVKKNDLFLAIKGEKVDGHRFIPAVMAQGAAAALCEDAPAEPCGPYILVQDVLKALQDIAAYYRDGLSIPIVGITGSVGKTSTKECIASVLSQKFCVLKTEGNFNNEIGVPLTLLKIREEHEAAVLEMGINHFGEMHRLGRMVRPDVMVYTNIGECHLEFLGTRDGILQAKTEVLEEMNPEGSVIVNGDDDKLSTLQDQESRQLGSKQLIRYGQGEGMDISAYQLRSKGLFGTDIMLETPKGSKEVHIPLPGSHMIYNAMAAAAVGMVLGCSLTQIADGIAAVQPTGGRSNIIRAGSLTIIDDCYNANPVSMCAALDLLALSDTRKAAILGDMFELGEDSAAMHARVGRYAAQSGTDVVICIGEQSRYMADEAQAACTEQTGTQKTQVYYYKDRDTFLAEMDTLLQPGDTILVKASHGMQFTEIVERLQKSV